ncbi:MAG: HAD family phosphatase [Fusobacteriaceae bacterium]|nr:HAD family phosphatase [Fusobacteriaceae bacterium]
MGKFKGVIFDADGTLLDSMSIWRNLGEWYLQKKGIVARPGLFHDLQGFGMDGVMRYLKETYDLREDIPQITKEITELVEDFYIHKVQAKSGVREFLQKLAERGIPGCVATSNYRYLVEPALKRCGISAYLPELFTTIELETAKDTPFIYQHAAGYLGTKTEETLVFEDALHAVRTARLAGFPVVAVLDDSERENRDAVKALTDLVIETFYEAEGILDA